MVSGAVGNNNLALWWNQWLLQVQITLVFEKILEVEVIYFFLDKWKDFHSLASKVSLLSSYVVFDVLELSWVSQWDKPHDVFHMDVDLCQVLNPCPAMCWESEIALLTNWEGDRWASCYWKPIVSLRTYNSMGSSLNLANKYDWLSRTHFDVGHDHMHLRALLENFPMRVLQVTSPNFGAVHKSRKH